jgi:cytochrome c biogenesis protein CcmG/thiol:disulfide interchange protein DsbE
MELPSTADDDQQIVETPRRRSIIFDRLVPIVAGSLVIGLLALLGYSLLRPDLPGSGRSGLAINAQGALVNVDPRPARDFRLELFEGGTVQLSEFRGQIVVVNFWASWCPPCREEAPALEAASRALRDEGVVFVGVDVWDDRDDALAFIDAFGVSYPNGPDDDGIAIEYGVTGIPETYIIDRDGRLAAKFVGPITTGQLIDTVRSVGP